MPKKQQQKGGSKKKEESKAPLGGGTKHKFKTYSFRGIELDNLLKMSLDEFARLVTSRPRRRLLRGLNKKPLKFLARCRKAKKLAGFGEKPAAVKTHLRDMIIVPEMIGSVVGVHAGNQFTPVEIKDDMIGHKLGEFALTYKPIKHGRPGIGATHSSRFIPLK